MLYLQMKYNNGNIDLEESVVVSQTNATSCVNSEWRMTEARWRRAV